MLTYPIKIEGLKGVGNVELDLQDGQRAYVLIGENGVGKTKTLEALFQSLFFTNEAIINASRPSTISSLVYTSLATSGQTQTHSLPINFLASQNRGFIEHSNQPTRTIGTLEQRRSAYFSQIMHGMQNNFTSLNMGVNIEKWFVTLAQSANPYQKKEDNRQVEIKVLLELLHKLDRRIDSSYMQIGGDSRVSLKIDGQPRELSHLSTGFASILKILQAIISGYGNFTNETNLQKVKGIILIDEIESHLHLSWQAKIIPLLKELFPNTTFYITTHSSVVLSQLNHGEAYRLQRDDDGVVRTKTIKSPNKASLIDVLKDAFDIDLNRLKLDSLQHDDQKQVKQQLLDLINQQG